LTLAATGMLVAASVGTVMAGPAGSAATFVNWPEYLYGPSHSSDSPATTITPANAANLKRLWNWRCPGPTVAGQPSSGFVASPTVYDGTIYIGCNTGVFYAISETTPTVLWSQQLGYESHHTCAARGISSTAAVAVMPSTGELTVYVAGGDGDLFALDAATGSIDWQSVIATPSPTQNNYYDWSSPTVANGLVYVGVSSQCDAPLVADSGLKAYDMSSGALEATFLTMPANEIGGSIWSSAAADSTGVFVDTGNNLPGTPAGESSSMIGLTTTALTQTGSWAIPGAQQVEDNDWAASPTLFTATLSGVPTEMVTACNKNGFLYAMKTSDVSAGPVWTFQVGAGTPNGVQSCLGAAIWTGQYLLEPGNATTINGTPYAGSLRELNPAT
jgi:glucose dehydrogenase